MITIGSLFSGIGGFDLGCQRALDRYEIQHKILYHVEQNTFCQSILKKHWPESKIHNDVRDIGKHNLPYTDIIMGGFPCQNISVAGKQEGIHGEKSGLWWEMFRIISELRPRIIVLENVSNILSLGGREVLGSLASLGYNAEWRVIRSGADFGAPHIRKRWFCVAYSDSDRGHVQQRKTTESDNTSQTRKTIIHKANSEREESRGEKNIRDYGCDNTQNNASYSDSFRSLETQHGRSTQIISTREKIQQGRPSKSPDSNCSSRKRKRFSERIQQKDQNTDSSFCKKGGNYWKETPSPEPVLCGMDDGIPSRVARLKALGNAIVPQAAEYIFERIILSGLLTKTTT